MCAGDDFLGFGVVAGRSCSGAVYDISKVQKWVYSTVRSRQWSC